MKLNYIILTIIFLVAVSSYKQIEGFGVPWYETDTFVIPVIATLFVVAPLIYIIYKDIIHRIEAAATGAPQPQ
jgi:uncharacterized membrane protein